MPTPRRFFRRTLPLVGAALAFLATTSPRVAAAQPAGRIAAASPAPRALAERPRLVVLITVDQMRADHLDRFASQYTGGLARLRTGGAVFTRAFHDHAVTETAPGHATTLSGRFPRSTGILRNSAGVADDRAPLLTSRDAGASPFRFRGSTLIDWMRSRDPRSRALSISRKDRGAILPLGRAKEHVYWYATTNGEFTTSRWYADTLPDWIRRVNARRMPHRAAGRAWTLLLPPDAYAERDSQPVEHAGRDFTFPHVLPTDTARAISEIVNTPWMDELTAAAALEGVQALALGSGPAPDLLAVSFSATDHVGHRYGPDSREQHDNLLRLDRTIGAFVDSLYRLRDSSTIAFALTADHGVTPFPDVVAARSGRAPQPRYDLERSIRPALRAALRRAGVDTNAVTLASGLAYVNRDAFAVAGANPDVVLAAVAAEIRRMPGVARVDRVRDLARRDTIRDAVARRWLHMIPADAPVEWVLTPVEGAYGARSTTADHGTPHDDDAHVPVLFYGPWFTPGRVDTPALVADIAPTLAAVLGVPPTERLDGRARTEVIRAPAARR